MVASVMIYDRISGYRVDPCGNCGLFFIVFADPLLYLKKNVRTYVFGIFRIIDFSFNIIQYLVVILSVDRFYIHIISLIIKPRLRSDLCICTPCGTISIRGSSHLLFVDTAFPYDKFRAMLYLQIHLRQILADDPKNKKIDTESE